MTKPTQSDVFAGIADNAATSSKQAHTLPALPRPTQILNASSDNAGPVPVAPRLRTAKDLQLKVKELGLYYKKFRRRLEPECPSTRKFLNLETMDFRIEETDEHPGKELDDSHRWMRVRIPHYTGPAGRWRGWYREKVDVTRLIAEDSSIWIRFCAADYTAHVFINGRFVGSHTGLFAPFEFDVTPWLKNRGDNLLAVCIENEPPTVGLASWSHLDVDSPTDGDKIYGCTGLGWNEPGVGWHHCPPGAGLWQPVTIEQRPQVFVSDVFVRPLPDSDEVEVTLEVWNTRTESESLHVSLEIIPSNFEGESFGPLTLDVGRLLPEMSTFRYRLKMPRLRRWSTNAPWLYVARTSLYSSEANKPIDVVDTRFGVRTFSMDTHQQSNGQAGTFYLNHEEIVLRGANTMGHMQCSVFDNDLEQVANDMLIARAANLNFYRLTQRPVQPEIYDIADELGFMLQTDLPLFGYVRNGVESEVFRQAGEMERLVRQHPSNILVSLINEPMPLDWKPWSIPRSLRRDDLHELLRSVASYVKTHNPDRIVKACDGDYMDIAPSDSKPDSHCYAAWYTDHEIHLGRLISGELFDVRPGWRGGCGEYGAEGLDCLDIVMNDYPSDWRPLGPTDTTWTPERIVRNQSWPQRCRWYTPPETFSQWIEASQTHQAWAVRTMTDALRRRLDRINSTAVHLLIDAWPAGWMKSLMSWRRDPKPAWFELADALAPLAVNLHQQTTAIWAGAPLDLDVWIFDERCSRERQSDTSWFLHWEVCSANQQYHVGRNPVKPKAMQAHPVGRIQVPSSDTTSKRNSLEVRCSLVDEEARAAHTHQVEYDIWPRLMEHDSLEHLRGKTMGVLPIREQTIAERIRCLGEALGMNVIDLYTHQPDIDLIFIDPAHSDEQLTLFTAFTSSDGPSLYVVPQPVGSFRFLHSDSINIETFSGVYHAVPESNLTLLGPALEAAGTLCTRWWCEHRGRIDHTTATYLVGQELMPLVSVNATGWDSDHTKVRVPVVATRKPARGPLCCFDQTNMLEFSGGEPRAAWLAASVFSHLL
ncbi:glycoside hydrolase family 2 protein [Mucisphaera sp.]|uniref:glycoside hydrolase family 2 protein n=1 Tax=Mucisphaera sp. TaxID=2913024 RepID=UPI003D10766C